MIPLVIIIYLVVISVSQPNNEVVEKIKFQLLFFNPSYFSQHSAYHINYRLHYLLLILRIDHIYKDKRSDPDFLSCPPLKTFHRRAAEGAEKI